MKRTDVTIVVAVWLSVLTTALRAQTFPVPDVSTFASSSVYYVTLQDALGKDVNADYAAPRSLGAFVGDELRGTGQLQSTGVSGKTVFVVRVWGQKGDATQAVFRLYLDGVQTVVGIQPFRGGSDDTYGSPSSPLVFSVAPLPPAELRFTSESVTLSKLRDVTVTLTTTDAIAADRVQLVFSTAANGEPVAEATPADDSGLRWTVRGRYVGQHTMQIRYNGLLQEATCTVAIPAEYVFLPGWDWISFYAASPTGSLPLQQDGKWLPSLRQDDGNMVYEIRSQHGVLHYDSKYGYFGTLSALRPADGTYKVYSGYDEEHAGHMVINMGSEGLLTGSKLPQPVLQHGYTWVTYPHELDHTVATLAPWLSLTAEEGDMIIGRKGFAAFYDGEWLADDDFLFEAGQGYIYYTEGKGGKTVNWGPETMESESLGTRSEMATARADQRSVKPSAALRYPDTMPVVATLPGTDQPEEYIVEAYVGGELRGCGSIVRHGRLHISVAGTSGEQVTFTLIDKRTGAATPLPQTVTFADKAGSHRAPLALTAGDAASLRGTAITQHPTPITRIYDLQGRRVGQSSKLNKGIYIVNGRKFIKH